MEHFQAHFSEKFQVKFSSCQLENFRVEIKLGFWKKVWFIPQLFFTKVSQYRKFNYFLRGATLRVAGLPTFPCRIIA